VAYAQTLSVEERSAERRDPFADPLCGGCLYSHIAYPRQLAIKGEVIADAFRRIGRVTLPGPVAVAGSPEDGYRMRARLHVRGHRLGFFRENSHDVCDARATRQLLPATSDALERLMAAMRSLGLDAVREIELSENIDASERVVFLDAAAALDASTLERLAGTDGLIGLGSAFGAFGSPYVTDSLTIGGSALMLRRHVQSFFQGNRHLLGDLVAHVTERVPVGGTVLDLYAGVGLFAVAAAVIRGAAVVAVEGDAYAADDLHANAAAAGGQVTTVRGAVEGIAAGMFGASGRSAGRPAAETIIVDPPRTGLSREAMDKVLTLTTPRLIYVSCDVATLARDARRLVDDGYAIERIDGFDLFPNTPHVETVVVFMRES
jgi:23S rRNA (uracil1939-C5)-methyltransferase